MKKLKIIKILSSVSVISAAVIAGLSSAGGSFMSLKVSSPTAINRPDMKYTVNINIDGEIADIVPIGIGIRGDADGDGEATIRDAAYIARYRANASANPDYLPDFEVSLNGHMADANADGKLSIRDAAIIARLIAAKYSNPDITWDDL
ncbi:dockerin type I domain-containing protein [Porcipelethomonas sp.]|uniref:dockerin type I domain-containing protein n=1 Tax=Porcipelethomonas sp. TaxID=2981675 RepID=UPI003EF4D63D